VFKQIKEYLQQLEDYTINKSRSSKPSRYSNVKSVYHDHTSKKNHKSNIKSDSSSGNEKSNYSSEESAGDSDS